mgnify:CR=1 FL=1
MRTLAVSNYKGGVGKTTTAVNLAAIYAARGLRVLLIDLDPQASATDYFGLYDRAAADGRTSIRLLYENAAVADVAYETGIENLSVIPSIIELRTKYRPFGEMSYSSAPPKGRAGQSYFRSPIRSTALKPSSTEPKNWKMCENLPSQ